MMRKKVPMIARIETISVTMPCTLPTTDALTPRSVSVMNSRVRSSRPSSTASPGIPMPGRGVPAQGVASPTQSLAALSTTNATHQAGGDRQEQLPGETHGRRSAGRASNMW